MSSVKTSVTHPIRIDWILETLPGRIGLTFAPGKHATAAFEGGRWERDLRADLAKLKADGMGLQLCLLEDHELESLQIPRLVEEAEALGIVLRRLPIRDGDVPAAIEPVRAVVAEILAAAKAGTNVVIHCRGGLGRAGTIGGCALVASGFTPDAALERLRERRGPSCPENPDQKAFLRAFRL